MVKLKKVGFIIVSILFLLSSCTPEKQQPTPSFDNPSNEKYINEKIIKEIADSFGYKNIKLTTIDDNVKKVQTKDLLPLSLQINMSISIFI